MSKTKRTTTQTGTITPPAGLTLGGHTFRAFTGLDAAFGADRRDYPNEGAIPEEYQRGLAKGCEIFSALFFNGGTLDAHGRKLRDGVDAAAFYATLRALMCSFAPQHQIKEATCGWLIDTYTEATP